MKLLVLDGNSILNRAFYGIRLLTTKEGLFTNGIYGFLTMLQKILSDTEPQAVAIAFDRKSPTFRHKAYDGYKAQRKGMPEELAQQLPTLKELLQLLGYRLLECDGFEADDILGTLARSCREKSWDCVIATGDRDSLQLVGGGVTVRLLSTKMGQPVSTLYNEETVREEYGVTPPQLIDIKAIQGDSSDNIPGVPGIGAKGAQMLIQTFGSLDGVYSHLESPEIKPAMRNKLVSGEESARLSLFLGTIRSDAPVDDNPADFIPGPVDPEAGRLMARLELFKLMEKMGLSADFTEKGDSQAASSALCLLKTEPEALLNALRKQKTIYCQPAYENGRVCALYCAYEGEAACLQDKTCLEALWQDPNIRLVLHDSKPFFGALLRENIRLKGEVYDTLLAAYLLNPSAAAYDLSRLAQEYSVPERDGEEGIPEEARQAALLPALYPILSKKIEEKNQESLLKEIEFPLAAVLAGMELCGFAVDSDGILRYGQELQQEIDRIQEEIYDLVGYSFNINSPKQLGEALFVKLGLSHGKKTKTGYSTNAEVLESLKWAHPAVEKVLAYRTLTKLKSTYCDGLLKVVGEDGRIHSSFNQTETRTGRISSTEPNLQNIPVRTELGRELRRFFCARPGWVLVDADYSQIELRVLAHAAQDENMMAAFRENDDIHRRTASQVFHVPPEMVTPLMRSRAKAVNFGIVYGIGAFSLSKDIGVTQKEAKQYIEDYLHHFSGVDRFMKEAVEKAKERGYAETLFGRRRYLPELASKNFNMRSFGERVARNMPIQGAAADIIKIAMIRVDARLREEGLQAKLILQVHDELIVEAPKEEAQKVAALLTEEMEKAVKLDVPLIAEASIGETWYDAKG